MLARQQICPCGTELAEKIPKQSARSEYQMIFWTTCTCSDWPGALRATGQQKIGESTKIQTIALKYTYIYFIVLLNFHLDFVRQDEMRHDTKWRKTQILPTSDDKGQTSLNHTTSSLAKNAILTVSKSMLPEYIYSLKIFREMEGVTASSFYPFCKLLQMLQIKTPVSIQCADLH